MTNIYGWLILEATKMSTDSSACTWNITKVACLDESWLILGSINTIGRLWLSGRSFS